MVTVLIDNEDWPEGKCHFKTNGHICGLEANKDSFFCPDHTVWLESKSNQELLELQADGILKSVQVKSKVLHLNESTDAFDLLFNSWHGLLMRGYLGEEIFQAASDLMNKQGMWDSIKKQIRGSDAKWKEFEKIIAGIHRLTNEGAKVTLDEKIVGRRTNGQRQIDVSIRFKNGLYEYLSIVECKDYNKPVSIDRVEALRTKMEDVGAHHAIIVSKKGFQKGAKATAEAHNIDIYTLTEEEEDWTRKIIRQVEYVPFPDGIEFHTPPMPPSAPHRGIGWDMVKIRKDEHSYQRTLTELVLEVCELVYEQKHPLPCEVKLSFDEDGNPAQISFPVFDRPIPLYSITFKLGAYERVLSERTLDLPPRTTAYVYSDLRKGAKHRFHPTIIRRIVADAE